MAAAALACLAAAQAQAHDSKAPLDSDQKQFLAQYVLVRDALARDDLEGAKTAAAVVAANPVIHHGKTGDAPPGFVQDARKLIAVTTLADARNVFRSFSTRAVNVTEGKPGYYVAHCPDAPAEGRWIVTARDAGDNPYRGQQSSRCAALAAGSH